jgi:serine/threonine protein phosphatase PrpC
MEDSHISIDTLARDYPGLFDSFQQRGLANALYGIYDGHVGKRASAFVSDTLHDRICRDPAFPDGSLLSLLAPGSADNVASGQENQEAKAAKEERPGPDGEAVCVEAATTTTSIEQVTESICRAMEAGFLQTDREFIEDALKAENKWKDGSTAVVVLLLDSHIFVANVGDSEALLGKRTYNKSAGAWEESFEVLTEIHKPTVPAERARIEKEGGFIVGGRVGGLSVSRSFGDRNMKLPIEEDGFWHGVLVDPHPHVMHRQLSSTDSFLLLGCDGVWENWSHQESVEFVFEKLDEGLNVDELTEAITRRAHTKGSQDNISATLLLFRWA